MPVSGVTLVHLREALSCFCENSKIITVTGEPVNLSQKRFWATKYRITRGIGNTYQQTEFVAVTAVTVVQCSRCSHLAAVFILRCLPPGAPFSARHSIISPINPEDLCYPSMRRSCFTNTVHTRLHLFLRETAVSWQRFCIRPECLPITHSGNSA